MDAYQRQAEPANAAECNLPVLHLPQLIGLALGIDVQTIEFERHLLPDDRVLETVGVSRQGRPPDGRRTAAPSWSSSSSG